MLIPTGLSKKEKRAYVKKHSHQLDPKKINVGPKAGLQPPGGWKVILKGLVEKVDAAEVIFNEAANAAEVAAGVVEVATDDLAKVVEKGENDTEAQSVLDDVVKIADEAEVVASDAAQVVEKAADKVNAVRSKMHHE